MNQLIVKDDGSGYARPGKLVGALVSALVLVACGGPDETGPTEEPTVSATAPAVQTAPASPEPTAGPGSTPWPEPARPPAMERDDIEGAKAAAEYFLELYPYVYATGDLEVWEEMSHPECEFCRTTSEDVAEIFSQGGYGLGGEFIIEDVVATPPDAEYSHFRVAISGLEEPSSVHLPGDGSEDSVPGGPSAYYFAVLNDGQGWLVKGVISRGEES